jgi:hypothetical protein
MKAIYYNTTGKIRVYYSESNKEKPSYDAIVTVVWINSKTTVLKGGKGCFTKGAVLSVYSILYNMGCETTLLEREEGRKMPFATLQEGGPMHNMWVTDLNKLKQRELI